MPAPASELHDSVSAFRRFNRFYTRVIGVLDEQIVKSGFSLTEGRILFELNARGESNAGGGSNARDLGEELGLDAGYLSRLLRKLEDSGHIARTPSPADARQTLLRLTRKGTTAFADLNRRSGDHARDLLEKLTPARRNDLIRSTHTIESVLSNQSRAPFILRPHRPGDIGWVVQRQAALYVQEYGWDGTFEAMAARICADFIDHFDPRRERCWIADRDGEPLGCIFLVRDPEHHDTAKLRLLHVEKAARGMGLGKALVTECVQFARSVGYKRITLWTQSTLKAAHHLYQQAGFRLVAEQPHHSFGVDLVGQTWNLDL
jgi:DNA-binding MarR family transcriptional regulator/GNAT superfamily N-acetyltransferase